MNFDLNIALSFIYIVGMIISIPILLDWPGRVSPILSLLWPIMLLKHLIEESWKYFSHWDFGTK